MSAAVPAEHANMIMTIDQTVLRIIASSLLCPNATCLAGLLSPSVASLATLARQTGNVRRYRQGPGCRMVSRFTETLPAHAATQRE
jgi:hypothetical protein